MNWTVGPLPSAVYWRRRAIVAVPVVAVLATFAACAVTGGGGDGGQAALVATTPSDSASTISPSPTESADTYQDGSTAHPYMQTGPPPESPSAAAPAASQVSSAPAPAPSAAPTSPTPSPTPAGPVSCTDKDLSLIAATGAPAYKSGQHPRLSLVVTNTSGRECRRDVGAIQQELRVTAGTRRIWSSDDCAPSKGTEVRTLQPGEKRTYYLVWSGKTSTPGCTQARTRVGAGTYQLTARLGTLRSKPVSFKIVA